MNWYIMCFLRAYVEPLHTFDVGGRLLGVLGAVCKLSVLTISKMLPNSGFWVGWHHTFHVTV